MPSLRVPLKRVVLVAVFLACSQILAGDGRIPLSAPTLITQPGHYLLTKDLTLASGSLIDIATGNVTLDLNARTLTTASPSPAIRLLEGLSGNVTIRNGRLIGGGIVTAFFSAPRMVRLEDLQITSGEINITLADPGFDPIVDISGCRVVNGGIVTIHDPGAVMARIVNNFIQGGGIYVQHARNCEIAENSVRNGSIELAGAVGGNQVRKNSVTGGVPFGIFIKTYSLDAFSGNSLIVGNVVQNSGTGIVVGASYARVTGNVTSQNSGDGIQIADAIGALTSSTYIEDNQASGNGGCGIRFYSETGHTFRGNNVRDNGIPGIAGTCGGDLGTNLDAGGNIL